MTASGLPGWHELLALVMAFFFSRQPVLSGLVLLILVSCTSNQPPSVPVISGPGTGRAGDTLTFAFWSRDPEFGMVTYLIDWGDTTRQVWTPFFRSGDTVRRTHVFGAGSFRVRATSRDVERAQSGWSEPLFVEISP